MPSFLSTARPVISGGLRHHIQHSITPSHSNVSLHNAEQSIPSTSSTGHLPQHSQSLSQFSSREAGEAQSLSFRPFGHSSTHTPERSFQTRADQSESHTNSNFDPFVPLFNGVWKDEKFRVPVLALPSQRHAGAAHEFIDDIAISYRTPKQAQDLPGLDDQSETPQRLSDHSQITDVGMHNDAPMANHELVVETHDDFDWWETSSDESSVLAPVEPHSACRVQEDFEVVGLLGKGAFGKVAQVESMLDGQQYALKRIILDDPEARHVAHTEVRGMASLPHHPNIVRYYNSWVQSVPMSQATTSFEQFDGEASDDDYSLASSEDLHSLHQQSPHPKAAHDMVDVLYIQMELCDGSSLADWLTKNPLPCDDPQRFHAAFQQRMEAFDQLANGLKHMHAHDMEHQDINPRNVFRAVGSELNWRLGDFSFVNSRSESSPICNSTSIHGVGSALYAPPETQRAQNVDSRCGACDVFSLGVMLFEMCFDFKTTMERISTLTNVSKGLVQLPPLPDQVNGELLERIIMSMVDLDPLNRPSVSEVCQSLKGLFRVESASAEVARVTAKISALKDDLKLLSGLSELPEDLSTDLLQLRDLINTRFGLL